MLDYAGLAVLVRDGTGLDRVCHFFCFLLPYSEDIEIQTISLLLVIPHMLCPFLCASVR
jgi:hypothetical protein